MLSRNTQNVVVIGAGIVGAAAAYFLTGHGAHVTVLEGEAPAAGATGASDGAVSVATKRPGRLMVIAQQARALYEEFQADGTFAGVYHPRKTFLIARGELEMSLVSKHIEDLSNAGEPAQSLDREELDSLMPGLGPNVSGGGVVPRDGHALGYEVANRLLQLSSAVLVRHTAALAVRVRNGRVAGVETSSGVVPADSVVVAAGLGSQGLIGLPGVLVPRKGQMIVTDRLRPSGPALPGHIISAAYLAAKRAVSVEMPRIGLVIDPLVTGQLLIGGSRESGNDDRRTDVETIAAITREAIDLYSDVKKCRIIRTFSGVRTASRDGLPIVGYSDQCEGMVIATGFEGDGICLGPLMGRVAAELALGQEPSVDIGDFSPSRFRAEGAAA